MRILIVALGCAILAGCATTTTLSPLPTPDQVVRYDRGEATLTSEKEIGVVHVAPTESPVEGRIGLGIAAFNLAESPINLGIENIEVYTSAGVPVRTWTYDALVRERQNAATWAAVAVALSGAANAYSAAQPATIHSSGSAYGTGGSAYYSGTTTVYNPANAALAQQVNQMNTERNMSAISAGLASALENLRGAILRTTTIDPGQMYGGVVVAARPRFEKGESPELKVIVDFGGETHEFRFAVSSQ